MRHIRKISALFLWWYVLVFIIVMLDSRFSFLGGAIKNMLARYPYQWDFEFMFSALFLVWGVFLWREKKITLFSGAAFISQGVSMLMLAIARPAETAHFILDSILWLVLGALLIVAHKKEVQLN